MSLLSNEKVSNIPPRVVAGLFVLVLHAHPLSLFRHTLQVADCYPAAIHKHGACFAKSLCALSLLAPASHDLVGSFSCLDFEAC